MKPTAAAKSTGLFDHDRLVGLPKRSPKYCIGCGAKMPRAAVKKGWTITEVSGMRRGEGWFRQCGCLKPSAYHELIDDLFWKGRSYPRHFPVRREGGEP